MQSKMIEEENICLHNPIITNGRIVCRDCGLELGIEYRNSLCIGDSWIPEYKGTHTIQYVGTPQTNRYIPIQGTDIKVFQSDCKDGKNRPLDSNTIQIFNRLKKINKFNNDNHTELRTLMILNTVGNYLNVPIYILDDASFRYRKLLASKIHIINNASCIVFCLWDSIRHFKYSISLREVLPAFEKFGHKISKRLLIRDGCIYGEILYQNGIEKTVPKTPRDYISRHIGKLMSNLDIIEKRLAYKRLDKRPEVYVSELQITTIQILNKLEPYLNYRGLHPFDCSLACIYFANLLMAINDKRKILTQRILSDICGGIEYNLRDIYTKEFKPFYLKLKGR